MISIKINVINLVPYVNYVSMWFKKNRIQWSSILQHFGKFSKNGVKICLTNKIRFEKLNDL